MKLERIFIRISEEEKELYKKEAEKRDMTLSELIRTALKNEITGDRK
ncbi:ribbon-helix-helix protein, CopG family [Clostridium perfringens]